MKGTAYFLSILAVVAVFLCSCEKNGGKGSDGGDTDKAGQYIEFEGVRTDIAGTFFEPAGDDYAIICVTPSGDVSSYEELVNGSQASYIWIMFNTSYALDVEFGIDQDFEIGGYNAETGNAFTWDGETYTESLLSGTYRISFDSDASTCRVTLNLLFTTGEELYVDAEVSTEEEVESYENHITINNEVSPVRAVFCDDTDTDGTFSIYLTSAAIDYFEEIGEARSYVGITIDKDCLGREINISSSENRYEIGYYDNFSNTAKTASSEELSVFASGTFTVSENGEGGYGVSVDAVLPGTAISVRYDGPAKSVMESPGPAANEFTFSGGSPVAIMSAVLDRNGSIDGTWELYLSPVPGCTGIEQMNGNFVHISAWDYCFDGDIYGFSQHRGEGFYVEYGDTVWSSVLDSEDSSTGTLEAVIDGNTISVDFYNLSDGTDTLEGHYAGPVTIIEEGQI